MKKQSFKFMGRRLAAACGVFGLAIGLIAGAPHTAQAGRAKQSSFKPVKMYYIQSLSKENSAGRSVTVFLSPRKQKNGDSRFGKHHASFMMFPLPNETMNQSVKVDMVRFFDPATKYQVAEVSLKDSFKNTQRFVPGNSSHATHYIRFDTAQLKGKLTPGQKIVGEVEVTINNEPTKTMRIAEGEVVLDTKRVEGF